MPNKYMQVNHLGISVQFKQIDQNIVIQASHSNGKYFELDELEYTRRILPKNSTIIDVGANIGNHTVYYDKHLSPKKVIVIEPNPEVLPHLKDNIHINKCESVDSHFLGYGISQSRAKYNTFSPVDTNYGSVQLIRDNNGTIDTVRLDDIIDEQVDFIKIDVEGMELETLTSAERIISQHSPLIMIEVTRKYIDTFMKYLQTIQYDIMRTKEYGGFVNYFIKAKQGSTYEYADK